MASRHRKGPLDVLRSRISEVDVHAANDLFLYADNTGELYPQKKAILANLLRKILKGKYDSALTPKAFSYLMDAAAKRYVREMGPTTFTASTRRLAAKMMAEQEEYALKHGEYSLLNLTR